MSFTMTLDDMLVTHGRGARSHSAQGLHCNISSPAMKIPLPPRLWITDVEDDSSDEGNSMVREDGVMPVERTRVRSRFRHHKQRSNVNVPMGIFWDIENCQVPRGCSAMDVVAAIRAKFLTGRREAEFVVVCDVRKEAPNRLQELNDAQVNLIHVCCTQKNAADEKLRQCMRRFGELHIAPAALLLISGDINFAADLCDFRHRKNMEVILVHKQNTSSALIACASSHYCYNELTAGLPRNQKYYLQQLSKNKDDDDEDPTCEMEVVNLPLDQPSERVSRRLRRLADNCGGKVLRVTAPTASLKFPTPDHTLRAMKRMDGEDVFGRKISTRYIREGVQLQPAYSSDEGYSTAPSVPPAPHAPPAQHVPPAPLAPPRPCFMPPPTQPMCVGGVSSEWALALQQLPGAVPPPLDYCPPPAPKPRLIRGTHGSVNLDRSACSSSNSGDEMRYQENSMSRAVSPWNSSASCSEHSESDCDTADLTVTNLPPYTPTVLQEMLTKLFSQYVGVVRVSVWAAHEGPLASVTVRSEWDARLAVARLHKRRLDAHWGGRRLELSLGRPSPAPTLDVLKARLRAILLEQKNYTLPLLRLRDAYASRHCCALTTSDLARVKDTVVVHEGFGRMVQLVDLTPVTGAEMEEAPWKCHIHAAMSIIQEDGSRILQPVFMEVSALAENVRILLENHGGILPLLSFVECYEATFAPLVRDVRRGVALELLLRSASAFEVRDVPSRHLTWRTTLSDTPSAHSSYSESSRSSGERDRPRTAPALEPMLTLFERELVDLLRSMPRCTIPFSKLIPAFHHHFGRQCRVADYGFTKLPDLLAALGNTIVVLGSGSSRVITLSAAAQARRWSGDLAKVVRAQAGRGVRARDLPDLYRTELGAPLSPADYGVCTLRELLERTAPAAVLVAADGSLALPRRAPTPDERARIQHFIQQAVELLCHTPNLRMEFSRFVPEYHAHFARQLRVAHYGCSKLAELFELVPEAVRVCAEADGERSLRVSPPYARPEVARRLRDLAPLPLAVFPAHYALRYGALPEPDMLDVQTLEELVFAAGGFIENEVVVVEGDAGVQWAKNALCACAVLCGDRSVARGSTPEYFAEAYRRLAGVEPDLRALTAGGVVCVGERRVRLAGAWRVVWRLAQVLADSAPLAPLDMFLEYTKRYEPTLPGIDTSVESLSETAREAGAVFSAVGGGCWALRAGVAPPRWAALAPPALDYSLHDTPPGQKGSSVFESPKTNIWCSPPASALPAPTALLAENNKRRTRLAAQFDSS